MLKLDSESQKELDEFEKLKKLSKAQNRAPRRFYNNLKNVALSQTYAKCNPWLGDGPTVGCHSKYLSRNDIDKEYESITKKISYHIHDGVAFRGTSGISDKERKKNELPANCHNQPSE